MISLEFLKKYQKIWGALFVALLIVAAGSAFYFWRQAKEFKENPQNAAQKEVRDVVSRVGKLLVLPEGETPTVATVTDPDQLKDQPFFARAKTGDKVLIYANAKRAILYDPVADKIIEVAPLNIGPN